MGIFHPRLALMRSTHIALSLIAIIVILIKLAPLRHVPQIPNATIISEGFTAVQQDRFSNVGEDSVVASNEADLMEPVSTSLSAPANIMTDISPTQDKALKNPIASAVSTSPSPGFLSQEPLPLPDEYTYQSRQSDFCIDRFTTKYLNLLRDGKTDYCARETSTSSLSCFHTPPDLHNDRHVDSLCIGQDVYLNKNTSTFTLDCIESEDTPAVLLSELQEYWYATGPHAIFRQYLKIQTRNETAISRRQDSPHGSGARNFTILLKREGSHNIFHSIHEIISLSYTMDVLRMTRDPQSGEAFFKSPEDYENTRIVVLDDHPEGPYWDLWRLFSNQKPMYLSDLVAQNPEEPLESLGNVIVPLAGAANPIWQDRWEERGCRNEIRGALVQRVLDFYGIEDDRSKLPSEQLTMTIVDRKQTRRLFNLDLLVNATQRAYPDIRIQVIDWAALPFKEQVRIARGTDILLGIHGAGLTQALFMKEGQGAMVEIMPSTGINCFHAIAMERNLKYFRAHGKVAEVKEDWHNEDVFVDPDKFLLLVDHAVKSLYNRPGRFRDLYD